MLSRADAELICRDRELPALATLLDGDALGAALLSHVPALRSIRIDYVRYKPGTSCIGSFTLETAGGTIRGYAKAFRAQDADRAAAVVKRIAARQAGIAQAHGARVLDGLACAVIIFPADDKIRSAAFVADEANRRRLLARVFRHEPELQDAQVTLLRYKPERRVVTSIEVGGAPRALLKLYSAASYRASRSRARRLNSIGLQRLPRLIGHSDRHRALAFAWLEGRSAAELLTSGADPREVGKMAGETLAMLHHRPTDRLNKLPERTRVERAASLSAIADDVRSTLPRLSRRATRLAREIASRLDEHPRDRSLIHGDFYSDQLLVDGNQAALIDFDRCELGDGAADLASFCAHLEWDEIRRALSRSIAEQAAVGIFEGYAESGPLQSDGRQAIEKAASLLLLATHPFRLNRSEYADQTSEILDRSEKALGLSDRIQFPVSSRAATPAQGFDCPVYDPLNAASDPGMPFLRSALDPAKSRAALWDALPEPWRGETAGIRVVRHKAGRRCLVEYDVRPKRRNGFDGPHTFVGKFRAKGADERTFALMVSLWNGEFGRLSDDGVRVPEPVGLLPEFNGWLQLKVSGTVCGDHVLRPDGLELVNRIIAGLHKLHSRPLVFERRHTLNDELAILKKRFAAVALERPEWVGRLERGFARCVSIAQTIPVARDEPIHRDFHPDNVLCGEDALYFLDFDLHAMGDPALDAGNFVAHLIESELRETGAVARSLGLAAAVSDAFSERYRSSAARSVEVYTALSLARHIHISASMTERRHATTALLEYCEELLGIASPSRVPMPQRRCA